MAKNKRNKQNAAFAETASSLISGTITVFLVILAGLFPLVYHKSYLDILETKYKFWCVAVGGMVVVVAVLGLVLLVIDWNEFKGAHTAALFSRLKLESWKKTFHLADAAAILFLISALISTILSEYRHEAFWGNKGRYSGLFLIAIYVIFYFVVSRLWKVRGWLLEVFLASGMAMCMLGITDYFQLDILKLHSVIKSEQSAIFTSTIGNINTYTAYVALVMGVAVGMFAGSQNRVRTVWYGFCMVTSFFAIVMGCSDNAYLALGAMFLFLPFIMLRNRKGIVRYLVILASFVTVIRCIAFLNQAYAGSVIGLDSLFGILANIRGLTFMAGALWLAAAILYFIWKKSGKMDADIGDWPVRLWVIALGILFVAGLFVLYDTNVAGNAGRYGSLGGYLVFNDHWGTNRGYIWRKSLEVYRDFPLAKKLFGYGPDTFGILSQKLFGEEMAQVTGQIFDTAHNEYIQFLLTIGFLGTASYVTFLVASCWRMVKILDKNPCVLACLLAVLCYCFQATVNLNLPVVTPAMWLLLSVGVASGKE